MTISFKYDIEGDALMRLRGTVVLHQNKPVYVNRIYYERDNEFTAEVSELPLKRHAVQHKLIKQALDEEGPPIEVKLAGTKNVNAKELYIAPLKLGYVNYKTTALFLSRTSYRVQKQGTCGENTTVSDPTKNLRKVFDDLLNEQCFVDALNNKYPSFNVALLKLEKGVVEASAFHSEFALIQKKYSYGLLWHNTYIGDVNRLTKEITLIPTYKCFKEMLLELGLKVKE